MFKKLPKFQGSVGRVMANFSVNVLGQVLNGVYQIVLVPLFLHYWSKESYGEWLVLFSIPSLLWSLEGGLSGVAVNRMTVASATGNWDLANSLFQNVFFAQTVLCAVVLGLAAFVTRTVSVQDWFHLTQSWRTEVPTILLVLLAYMFSAFYVSLFRAAYRSTDQEPRGVMMTTLWKFVDFVVQAIALVVGAQALGVALTLLITSVFMVFLFYLDVLRKCPQVEFGFKRVAPSQLKSIFIDGMPLLAGQASGALFLQVYPLIINRVLGASFVVNFVSVRTVSRTVLLFNQVFLASSVPEVSRSYGRKDWAAYTRLLKIMLAAALVAGMATILGLTSLGTWAISLWTGGKVIVSHPALFLFGVSVALQGIWAVGSYVLVASNMHHLWNYIFLGVSITTLALANFVVARFGFLGVPAMMVFQDLALTLIVFGLCKSKLSHISLSELRHIFSPTFYWSKVGALFNRSQA